MRVRSGREEAVEVEVEVRARRNTGAIRSRNSNWATANGSRASRSIRCQEPRVVTLKY
jgi:hypothetical protein